MGKPRVKLTLGKVMILVAASALLISAWQFYELNQTTDRSYTGILIRQYESSSGDASTRKAALENLSKVEPGDLPRVLSALERALGDRDEGVRAAAAHSIGSTLQGCVARVDIGSLPEYERGLALLLRASSDPGAEVRLKAVQGLVQLREVLLKPTGPPNPSRLTLASLPLKTTIDPLLRLVKDSDARVRAVAVWAFSGFGPTQGNGPDVVLDLMTSDPDFNVRASSVRALVTGWPETGGLYPRLLKRLREAPTIEETSSISWSLGSLPPPTPDEIAPLVQALSLESPILAMTIPNALAKAGPIAKPALPKLAEFARSELASKEPSGLNAAMAVASIDRDSAEAQSLLAPLVSLLETSQNNFSEQQASIVLGKYGASAAPSLDALRNALGRGKPEVQRRIAWVIGSMGSRAKAAIPDLKALAANSPDKDLRGAAANAAARIEAANIVPEIEAAVEDH